MTFEAFLAEKYSPNSAIPEGMTYLRYVNDKYGLWESKPGTLLNWKTVLKALLAGTVATSVGRECPKFVQYGRTANFPMTNQGTPYKTPK